MATKKTVKEKTVKPKVTKVAKPKVSVEFFDKESGEVIELTPELVTELQAKKQEGCPFCVNGRIPQNVEWHYVSCDKCNGTGMK